MSGLSASTTGSGSASAASAPTTQATHVHARPGDDLQAKLDAAAPGGIVQFAPGRYELPDTLYYGDALTLRGAGPAKTIFKLADGLNSTVLGDKNGTETDVEFRNFTIDGNRANNSGGTGIRARPGQSAGDGFTLENLLIRETAGEAIHLGGENVSMNRIRVDGSDFNAIVAGLSNSMISQFVATNVAGFGFSIGHVSDCLFEGIWIANAGKAGINLEDCDRYRLDGFAVIGCSPANSKAVRTTGGIANVVQNGYIDISSTAYQKGQTPPSGGVRRAVGTDPGYFGVTRNIYVRGDGPKAGQSALEIRANSDHGQYSPSVSAIRAANLKTVVNLASGGAGIYDASVRDIHGYNTTTLTESRGDIRTRWNGVGTNNGDPRTTGEWNGYGAPGLLVRDTTNQTTFLRLNGSWVPL